MNVFKYINLDTGKTIAKVYEKEIKPSHKAWNEEDKCYDHKDSEDQYTVKLTNGKADLVTDDIKRVESFIRNFTGTTNIKRMNVLWTVYEPFAYFFVALGVSTVFGIAAAIIIG